MITHIIPHTNIMITVNIHIKAHVYNTVYAMCLNVHWLLVLLVR